MALTYALTQTPDNKLVFRKERSYFTTVVAVIGGLLFAFGGLAIPVVTFKVLVFLGGIAFSVAAIYLPLTIALCPNRQRLRFLIIR